MKKLLSTILAVSALLLVGCSSSEKPLETPEPVKTETVTVAETTTTAETTTEAITTKEAANLMPERIYPDNPFKELSLSYDGDASLPQGTVVKFTYETKNHLSSSDAIYEKYALVYLPASYDENDTETKYNVLYLMHGGSDSPEWYLNGEGKSSSLAKILDTLIARGEMEPVIICAVSYYTEYSSDATKNCIDFYHELMNDVIPVFEKKYNIFSDENKEIMRRHRAFGGFSMGAVATWSVFENCLDDFAYFMPMSGDCWALGRTAGGSQATLTAEHLADAVKKNGRTADDFKIYAGCGGTDIAKPNLMPQIEAMKKLTDTFVYCDNFSDGNLYHCLFENGGHDLNTVLHVMYNALPKMFG